MTAPFSGPVAGGPWHGRTVGCQSTVVYCPVKVEGVGPVKASPAPDFNRGEYWWHALLRMWIWKGPNTCSKKEPM